MQKMRFVASTVSGVAEVYLYKNENLYTLK